jgi:hypothetical protein
MDKFLKQVAGWLNDNFQTNASNFTMVFPNRRAGVFFRQYYAELIEKPQFSPNITTITDLVGTLAATRLADPNALIVELFKVYREHTKSAETLDDFFYWGEMMLADFNDIDKYLIDARQLFGNIQSLKEIDAGFDFLTKEQLAYISAFWANILAARTSENKDHFLSLWKNLYGIYQAFNQRLDELGVAYEGRMYRKMVENLPSQEHFSRESQLLIVGFNALNECEIKLLNFLKNNCQTHFFWDYDSYYLENEHHEAALFMRQNLQRYPMPYNFDVEFNNFSQLKAIDVVAVPGFSGQATLAANWLSTNKSEVTSRFDNTALVLCDENLLMPMLNTIPENIESLNITMGYPVKSSPAYALIKSLTDIERNARKDQSGSLTFYYRNVLALLNNSLLKSRWKAEIDQLSAEIQSQNKIYIKSSDFPANSFLKSIFELPETAADCKSYLQQILMHTFNQLPDEEKLLKETIYQLYLALNRIHDNLFSLNQHEEAPLSKRLYYQVLLRQMERLTVPFEGEPLSGMQLMGFLETRCLDFDNLVLLSLNDERLPGNPHQHSFIPYSLRKGFGLPVAEQRNAMYAYYFYRLIQRAKKVTLVYDSRTEGLCSGEVSRFVTQMKFEAAHLKINELQAKFNFEPSQQQEITIVKSGALLNQVENHLLAKRISPSALNSYIDCSLKFYFKYIENIKQTEDLAEEIDNLLFGRIAHVALEELYKPYKGKEVTKEIVQQLLDNKKSLESSLRKALQQEFFKKGDFDLNGRNLLVFDIIRKYVIRILKYDESITPFTLMELEKEFETTMEVDFRGTLKPVCYGGVVDRIDQVGDIIRVVDYKTGKSDSNIKEIEKLFVQNSNRNKAAFQTMLYAGCVQANLKTTLPLMPVVYGARSVFKPEFDPAFNYLDGKLIYQANAEPFQAGLKALLQEIIDPEVPFTQTKDLQTCSYCEYNVLCNR